MSEKLILESFGNNLKKIRLEKGMSQENLAHLCELDRTYISGIERGKRNLSLINIFKIANALDIQPFNLLVFQINEDMYGFFRNRGSDISNK
jgi:transcriptional regulator with XRE-family HTH domain